MQFICRIVAAVFIFAVSGLCSAQTSATKRLIEFGWDEPSTSFMRQHIAEMEQMPFNGCVFHVEYKKADGSSGSFMSEAWGKRSFSLLELQPAIDDLRRTSFKQMRHNFARFNVTPGDTDWFGDFSPVLQNAKLLAFAAHAGPCDGVLFDIEQYANHLFDYRAQPSTATLSFDAYTSQVRLRGKQLMHAFQQGYPDLTVLLTYGYSLPLEQTYGGKVALRDTEYALLPALLDGMLEAAEGKACLVDGYEVSYGFKNRIEYETGLQHMRKEVLPLVADPRKYAQHMRAGFGIWLDFDSQKRGYSPDHPEQNYFTPTAFGEALSHALEFTDQYVWIYTEKPKWWTAAGRPENLPQAYVEQTSASMAFNQKKPH